MLYNDFLVEKNNNFPYIYINDELILNNNIIKL